MVFKKLLAGLGLGGVEADTVLSPQPAAAGGPLTGQVNLRAKSDTEITAITLILVAQGLAGSSWNWRGTRWHRPASLVGGNTQAVPFSVPVPATPRSPSYTDSVCRACASAYAPSWRSPRAEPRATSTRSRRRLARRSSRSWTHSARSAAGSSATSCAPVRRPGCRARRAGDHLLRPDSRGAAARPAHPPDHLHLRGTASGDHGAGRADRPARHCADRHDLSAADIAAADQRPRAAGWRSRPLAHQRPGQAGRARRRPGRSAGRARAPSCSPRAGGHQAGLRRSSNATASPGRTPTAARQHGGYKYGGYRGRPCMAGAMAMGSAARRSASSAAW